MSQKSWASNLTRESVFLLRIKGNSWGHEFPQSFVSRILALDFLVPAVSWATLFTWYSQDKRRKSNGRGAG